MKDQKFYTTDTPITVAEAERLVLEPIRNFGTATVFFEEAVGSVLAANILADRDLPPYDRVAMDGIAIQFESYNRGIRSFKIKATQAAGDAPVDVNEEDECIEIMTGAALPPTTDTVIRYEDLLIENGRATILSTDVIKSQHIHHKGRDKKKGEIIVEANQLITPAIVGVAASVGAIKLQVKKFPSVVIISTGDELVPPSDSPSFFQIRQSNNYTIRAVLKKQGIQADTLHVADDKMSIEKELQRCLQTYDVLLLSGGVSMGKFDLLPQLFEASGIQKIFHKVQQRPGKPFWFGVHPKAVVFAFPGNPVSAFMCLHRYFIPWVDACLGLERNKTFALLDEDITFAPPLSYFMQVKLTGQANGCLTAKPVQGNGSGDFAHLSEADAFMELPLEKTYFKKGEAYRIWPVQ